LTDLEIKFDNFRIEDVYTRLIHIQNEFIELGEPLSNNMLVEKLLRVLLRKPRWEGYVSTLEVMQSVNTKSTMDEIYALLHGFE
jgi:hypothetical protein